MREGRCMSLIWAFSGNSFLVQVSYCQSQIMIPVGVVYIRWLFLPGVMWHDSDQSTSCKSVMWHLPMELVHSRHFPVSDAKPSATNTSSSFTFQPITGYNPTITDNSKLLQLLLLLLLKLQLLSISFQSGGRVITPILSRKLHRHLGSLWQWRLGHD